MNEYLVFFTPYDKHHSCLVYAKSLEDVEKFLEGCDFYAINGTIYSRYGKGNIVPDSVPEAWQYFADYCKNTERIECV